MKLAIDKDEWYPVRTLLKESSGAFRYGVEVEVDEEFLEYYNRVMDDFETLQRELADMEEQN